jgi:lipopolysaccharide export LptBFGC system permease protein LptF
VLIRSAGVGVVTVSLAVAAITVLVSAIVFISTSVLATAGTIPVVCVVDCALADGTVLGFVSADATVVPA